MILNTDGINIKVVPALCTGCRLCELACSLFHEGAVNPEKGRPG